MSYCSSNYKDRELTLVLNEKEKNLLALKESMNQSTYYRDLLEVYDKDTGFIKLNRGVFNLIKTKEPLAMCFIDIDNLIVNHSLDDFQRINLLDTVHEVIRKNVRRTDYIFVYGKKEIAILFPSVNIIDAGNICRRIDKQLLNLISPKIPLYVRIISIGLSEYDIDVYKTPEEFIKDAYKKINIEKMTKKVI
ncbi:diguanylate cyclase [Alkaliphilus serpentinus]|nr:diguanylate cyclase [Alkaliphilus serpentinus]